MTEELVKSWAIFNGTTMTGYVALIARGKGLRIAARLPAKEGDPTKINLQFASYRGGSAINEEAHIERAIVGTNFLNLKKDSLVPLYSFANGSRPWQEQLRLAGYRVTRLSKKDDTLQEVIRLTTTVE